MQTLIIDDKVVENIFKNEFNGNVKEFLDFIKRSYSQFKKKSLESEKKQISLLQIDSMKKTWDNEIDEQWDNL